MMASIQQEVDARERNAGGGGLRQEALRFLGVCIGVTVYALGINLFLRPLHLYSGGFMGFAQLIDTFLRSKLGYQGRELSGIFYYIMNVPGLIIAFRVMQRRFVVKTVLTVTVMTIVLTLIPIPETPVLEERLANCLIAGIMSGSGIGLVLRMGACDGGMDIVGMILIQTKGNVSVGGVNIAANCVLYGVCLLLFDAATVVYSLIYSVISSLTCDRVHTQNINVRATIITKLEDASRLEIELMGGLTRGLTFWEARGGYTNAPATVIVVVISKYEIHQLKTILRESDPDAFVIIDEGVGVLGHFLKKIT